MKTRFMQVRFEQVRYHNDSLGIACLHIAVKDS